MYESAILMLWRVMCVTYSIYSYKFVIYIYIPISMGSNPASLVGISLFLYYKLFWMSVVLNRVSMSLKLPNETFKNGLTGKETSNRVQMKHPKTQSSHSHR